MCRNKREKIMISNMKLETESQENDAFMTKIWQERERAITLANVDDDRAVISGVDQTASGRAERKG
jgi:hypothetical protein